jgi:hypothetical protein
MVASSTGPGGVFLGRFPITSSLCDRRCVGRRVPRTLAGMRFLRDINAGEMLALIEQWAGPIKAVFLSIPELAPLLPRVQEDHDALLTARAGSAALATLRTLLETADALDERHDHLQRALHHGLLSAREARLGLDPPDHAVANQIDAAYERLLPKQLDVINASYEAEAGNASQMVNIADKELTTLLSAIPIVSGISALDLVHEIGKVGAALGGVEQNKSVTAAAADQEAVAPAEVRRRMRACAVTIETVIGALGRTKAPADAVAQIRQPVLDAIGKARARVLDKRNAAKKKEAEETGTTPADKPPAEKAAVEKTPAEKTPAEEKAAGEEPTKS